MGVEQTLRHLLALRRYARLLTGHATRAGGLVQVTLERACVKWAPWQPGSGMREVLLLALGVAGWAAGSARR